MSALSGLVLYWSDVVQRELRVTALTYSLEKLFACFFK